MRFVPMAVALLAFGTAFLACRAAVPRNPVAENAPEGARPAEPAVDAVLAKFSRLEIPVDASSLSAGDTRAARKLIEAGAFLERAFWQQSYRRGWEIRTRLEGSSDPLDRKLLDLVLLNAGPFDRLRNYEPFDGGEPRPKGGGFYPEDLTEAELDAYLQAHPAEKEALLSPWTVVRRQGDRLVAVPFHEEYAEWIRPAAERLREAADLADDPGMARYLRARAEALLTDSYGASDRAFLETRGSALVVFVGPQSTGYDQLKRVKQAYSMMVGIRDEEESRRVAEVQARLDEVERRLPLAEPYRRTGIRPDNAIEAVLDLFRAGSVAHGNLGSMVIPADPKARPDGGRNIFWKNVFEARGEVVIQPIARSVLSPGEERWVTPGAYFNQNVMHYVAHPLGPREAESGGRRVPVKEALGDVEGAIEETKAELASLATLDWAISQGLLPSSLAREHYATFVAHNVHIALQGTQGLAPPIHAKGAQMVLNWCREKGALTPDVGGRWRIDGERLPGAMRELLAEILELQATGDRERAVRLLDRYAVLGPELQAAVERAGAVRPFTFEPVFKVRWR
jgi:hypothetical protein